MEETLRDKAQPMSEQERIREGVPEIIAWYRENRRELPWRENVTAYTIWISEIMLQQTRIEAVLPYYRRFLEELPDIAALAAVEDDRLLKLWEGLGYYSRARNLKKAAQMVMEKNGGDLPRTAEELKKLPGIGEYTAGAIASIACGESTPAVDGNVMRVITRLLACGDDIDEPKTKRKITEMLQGCYPKGEEAGLLTEGLMELGEVLCLPNGAPQYELCPLRTLCLAHQEGRETEYPVRQGKKERRCERRTVFLLRCGERIALRKRPEKGLLAGLWEFPNCEGWPEEADAERQAEKWGLKPAGIAACGEARHVFTHVEWQMKGYEVLCREAADGFIWMTPEEMRKSCPVPTAFRFYMKKV